MTKLLKASLLLATPLLFAYGDNDNRSMDDGMTLSLGFEGSAGILEQSWGTASTATPTAGDALGGTLSHAFNKTTFRYGESNEKLPNYNFGGSAIVRTQLAEDFKLMLRFGISTGADDAKMFGTAAIGAAVSDGANPTVASESTWKSKMALAPAAFLGYDCLYVGAEYFMQEFEISGHGVAFEKSAGFKENQILFGLRGEMNYDMEDISLIVSVEAMSNFSAKSDSEADSYYKNLITNQQESTGHIDSVKYDVAATANAADIAHSSTHTNITRVSVNIGMMFVDF
ncbi:hypothetical protein [Candidatus Synchoanobacter obligatus]|uniref:Outer membrane protein beta-barrel domain-containing protein n=1 Tax=Candidatus Synchoanobacter obligatus TaxID=2919597 RepID=A0ABT1L5M1_9GAMM|nr:hypothetical protein [Candidatus Synchoanobacter obligatus]MCP8352466.1 hypothetical protein [Candidatus Synchoanobacter obligatus]